MIKRPQSVVFFCNVLCAMKIAGKDNLALQVKSIASFFYIIVEENIMRC